MVSIGADTIPRETSVAGPRVVGSVGTIVPWLVLPVMAGGLVIRLAAALRLPPHVDEGNMLLGIQTVAARGWPMLPSGVLYIHGATVSYLLAPLAWFGWVDYANLFPLRLFSAICGTVAVYLTYRLGRSVAGSTAVALLAAALIALDPLSVLWGGFIRMYALLQVLVLLVAWLFLRALPRGDANGDAEAGPGVLAGLVVAYWLAVFTQVVAAFLWPALA